MLAELCVGIPDVSVTSQSVQLENIEFSSDHRVNHSHEGTGSGKIVLNKVHHSHEGTGSGKNVLKIKFIIHIRT